MSISGRSNFCTFGHLLVHMNFIILFFFFTLSLSLSLLIDKYITHAPAWYWTFCLTLHSLHMGGGDSFWTMNIFQNKRPIIAIFYFSRNDFFVHMHNTLIICIMHVLKCHIGCPLELIFMSWITTNILFGLMLSTCAG